MSLTKKPEKTEQDAQFSLLSTQTEIENLEQQIERLTRFWKEQFNHDISWGELISPKIKEGLNVLEYIPGCFTEDHIFHNYRKVFGDDQAWYYHYSISKSIRESIKEQQPRPSGNRLILHRGGQGFDTEHQNRSYDDFYQDGEKYMIPIEGIISAFRCRVETGKMMDVAGFTCFHALVSDNSAMNMFTGFNGKFLVGMLNRDDRSQGYGPREISF